MNGNATAKRTAYHHGDLRRSVVEAALAILKETQQWDFSLREVARRAGVSHNAPYFHFADKRDLLAELAVTGFATLRARMIEAAAPLPSPGQALAAIGTAYVRFGEENPAHYRLMFGPTLMSGHISLCERVAKAAAASRSVLSDTIRQGATNGDFAVDADDDIALATATLTAWSLAHGLTMLFIDGLAQAETSLELSQLVGLVSERFRYGLARTREPETSRRPT